jgi:broad specificity phosphatase PhoE
MAERAASILWLMRHGDRIDDEDITWDRTAARPHDPGLSQAGMKHVNAAGRRLAGAGISRIFSSPYLRCVQTAGCVSDAIEAPVSLEPGLGELQHPDWGRGLDDLPPASDLRPFARRLELDHVPICRPVAPEGIPEAFARSMRTAQALASAHPGPLLLVGHAVSILGIVKGLAAYERDFPCPVASLFKLERSSDEPEEPWTVALLADTDHLAEGAGPPLVTTL